MDQSLEYQHSCLVYNNMVYIYKGKFIRIKTYFIDDSVLKVKSENQINSFSFSCQFDIICESSWWMGECMPYSIFKLIDHIELIHQASF